MNSSSVTRIIAQSGGIFSTTVTDDLCKSDTLFRYLRRKKWLEIISAKPRNEGRSLYKLKDSIIAKRYNFMSTKKKLKLWTPEGKRLFNAAVKKHMHEHEIHGSPYNKTHTGWYKALKKEYLNDTHRGTHFNYSCMRLNDFLVLRSIMLIRFYARYQLEPLYGENARELFSFYPRNFPRGAIVSYDYERDTPAVLFTYPYISTERILQTMHFLKSASFTEPVFHIATFHDPNRMSKTIGEGCRYEGRDYALYLGEYHIYYFADIAEQFDVYLHNNPMFSWENS